MKILYIAEIVSKAGVFAFKKALPVLKNRYPYDFLIASADGATGGGGLGRTHAAYIHKLGANALTLGECGFYKKDLTENFDKTPYLVRPANLSHSAPGIGVKIFKAGVGGVGGEKVAVAVLLGQNGFTRIHADNPFASLTPLLENLKKQTPNIIVDFHAQATAEKKTLFYAADGLCSAVIGSHTRVQTADEVIMEKGTAVITDAGRTGSQNSVGGCDTSSRIREYITGIPDWTRDAWECLEVQGVYLNIGKNGKAVSIERIKIPIEK